MIRWQSPMLVCALFLIGCGSEPAYKGAQRFAISGKVTLDGMPLEGGTISFIGGAKENSTGAQISQGQYSIPENEGPNAGNYKVSITWMKPTGEKIADEDLGGTKDVVKEVIPEKYNVQTELKAVVAADKKSFDFDLKSK